MFWTESLVQLCVVFMLLRFLLLLIYYLFFLQSMNPSCCSPKSHPSRASFCRTTWRTSTPQKNPSSLKMPRKCRMWLAWALTWTPNACFLATSSVVTFTVSSSTTPIISAFVPVSFPWFYYVRDQDTQIETTSISIWQRKTSSYTNNPNIGHKLTASSSLVVYYWVCSVTGPRLCAWPNIGYKLTASSSSLVAYFWVCSVTGPRLYAWPNTGHKLTASSSLVVYYWVCSVTGPRLCAWPNIGYKLTASSSSLVAYFWVCSVTGQGYICDLI